MTTPALIGLTVIAVVVFLFVLEPILRARGDEAVLDAAALPRTPDPRDVNVDDADMLETADDEAVEQSAADQPSIAARRVRSDAI
jgi:hypothetical protein